MSAYWHVSGDWAEEAPPAVPLPCVWLCPSSFLGVGWDWIHSVHQPLTGLSYQPRITDEYGAFGEMRIGRGNPSTKRKPAPACPPQTYDRTRTAAVANRRLNTSSVLYWKVIKWYRSWLFDSSTTQGLRRDTWMNNELEGRRRIPSRPIWRSIPGINLQEVWGKSPISSFMIYQGSDTSWWIIIIWSGLCSGSMLDLYSRGARFESRLGHKLSFEFLVAFLGSPR
jgi:hypothetical protein